MARKHSAERLQGKIALVTGASRGIGLAMARALAAEGCDLSITARNPSALNRAGREVASTGVRVLAKACNVSNSRSVEALAAAVKKQFGRIDILINNAGISHAMATIDKLSVDLWQEVIATNLTGMFLVTHAALPLMHSGATVVNNLSVAAKEVFAGEAAYCASKHGALGFTNTLREELRQKGIRVIALLPGATDTEFWNQFWPDAPHQKMMSAKTVAACLLNALLLPANSTVEELTITPTAGAL